MVCTHITLSDRMICRAWSRLEKRDAELSKQPLIKSYENSGEERTGHREKWNKTNLNSFHAVSRRQRNIAGEWKMSGVSNKHTATGIEKGRGLKQAERGIHIHCLLITFQIVNFPQRTKLNKA